MADGSQVSAEDLMGPRPGGDAAAPAADGSAESLMGPRPSAPATPSYFNFHPFSSTPIAGPLMDAYFSNVQNPSGAAARILGAFNVGAKSAWAPRAFELPDSTQEMLKQLGQHQQQADDHASFWKSMSEAYMRSHAANAATGLAMETGGMQYFERLPATIGAIQSGVLAATNEAFGRDIAGMLEYGMSRGDILNYGVNRPVVGARAAAEAGPMSFAERAAYGRQTPARIEPIPPEITRGNELGTIGTTDAQWQGLEEREPLTDDAIAAAQKRADEEANAPPTQPGEPPAPSEEEGVRALPESQEPLDLEATRRQIAPEAFRQYDALHLQSDTYRRWLGELGDKRDADIVQPFNDQIAEEQAKIDAGATGRRLKTYQNRIADLTEQRDRALEEGRTDTPDMKRVRDALTQTRNKLFDLAPDISAATQQAADQLGIAGPRERLGEPAPAPPPAAPAEAAPVEQPPAAPEQAAEAQVPGEAPAPIAEGLAPRQPVTPPRVGGEQGTLSVAPEKAPVASIAEDVSKKLVAAGRPQEEAEAAAAIVDSIYRTRAAHLGTTAEELYRNEAPEIVTREPKTAKERKAGGTHTIDAEGNKIITLFAKADPSTFIHEVGHDTLDQMLSDAGRPDAPQQLKDDAATVRDWLGADPDTGTITDAQHEKFARGFERYFMEGTAPTPQLAGVFAKFKAWLADVYNAVKRLKQPPKINNEIRRVFDRLLTPAERTTIAPEREPGAGFADLHEAEAETTPPEGAHATAEQMRAERDEAMARHAPEVNDARLADAREETAGGPQGGGEPNGPNAGPVSPTSEAGLPEAHGAVGAGGSETPQESPRARAEVLEAADRLGVGNKLYEPVPRAPVRLLDWIKRQGGIKEDTGGEITQFAKGEAGADWEKDKRFKGLINPKTGKTLDDLALAAWEDGYLPEFNERPDINTLLNAIEDDIRGDNPRYSDLDKEAVQKHEEAKARNAEIDRIADEYGVDPQGKTKAEFWAEVAEKHSQAEVAKEMDSLGDAQQAEFDEAEKRLQEYLESRGEAWEPEDYLGSVRTVEDLEREYQQEQAAAAARPGPRGVQQPEGAPGPAEPVQGERGQGGGGIRVVRRDAGEADESAAGSPTTNPNAAFGRDDDLVDKAGNIRLDNLNTEEDAKQALRDIAASNNDFVKERRGVVNDSDLLAFAESMGVDASEMNIKRLQQMSHDDDIPFGSRILAGRMAMIQAAEAARDAAVKAVKDGAAENEIAAYAQARERLAMIARAVAGATAEWGRAGRGFRNLEGFGKAEEMAAAIEESTGRTLFQLQQEAARVANLDTPGQAAQAIRQGFLPEWKNVRSGVLAYFLNNLISGPITHLAYGASNFIWTLFKTGINGSAAAAAGAFEANILGHTAQERVYFADVAAGLHAMFTVPGEALPNAMRAFKTGIPYMRGLPKGQRLSGAVTLGEQRLGPQQIFAGAPPGSLRAAAGRALETPSRAIAAIHTMSYSIAFESDLMRQAVRQAIQKGLVGDDYAASVAKFRKDPPPSAIEDAHTHAMKSVLMERPAFNTLQGRFQQLTNKYFLAKIAFPFVQIGANLAKEGLLEQSPFAPLYSAEARADLAGHNGAVARQERVGRMTVGIGIAGAAIGATAAGLITGPGPSDPRARADLERAGWRPFAVKVGGTYIPYTKWLGPLALYIGAASTLHDAAAHLDEHGIGEGAHTLVSGISEQLGDILWLGQMADLFDTLKQLGEGRPQSLYRYMENIGNGFLPFSTMLNQARQMVDPTRRRVSDWADNVMNHIPYASYQVQPMIDWRGNPVTNPGFGETMVSPQINRVDPVTAELGRLNMGIARPKQDIKGVALTPEEYTYYAQHRGAALASQLDRLTQTQYYRVLPDTEKKKLILQAERSATFAGEAATQTAFRQHLIIEANKARNALLPKRAQ